LQKVQDVTHDANITKIPTLTNEELKYLWREFTEINNPILRIIQIYPNRNRLSEKNLTAIQYFELLERIHLEHEDNCIILKQKAPMFA
jgi:hypothetical protein